MRNLLSSLSLTFALIFSAVVQSALAQNQTLTDSKIEALKTEVARRLANGKERVSVKLRTGTEIKGRITQANASSFTIMLEKAGQQTEVAYGEVAKLTGRGMSKWTKIGLIAGAAVVVVVVIGIVSVRNFDPFENGILR